MPTKPVLASSIKLLPLTLSHWPVLRDLILKYHLQNRMLNESLPMFKLLLRTIADIELHLLKWGSVLSPGDSKSSPAEVSHPPSAESWVWAATRGLLCRGQSGHGEWEGGHLPKFRGLGELHGEAGPCPGSLLITWAAWCVASWESVRTRGCLGPRDGYVKKKDPVGMLCVCRAWVGKVLGLSVSLEWTLRGSGAWAILKGFPPNKGALVERVCKNRPSRTRCCGGGLSGGPGWGCTAPLQVMVQGVASRQELGGVRAGK